MEEEKTTQPTLGTWERLPTEETERKPKVSFEVNIPVIAEFLEDDPTEMQGETGTYYLFNVKIGSEEKVIMTSAWTLLRALKIHSPLKGKFLSIVKKLTKGKQGFEVSVIEPKN